MMSVLPTPRMANEAALKPLILFAEKFGTSKARSAIVRGVSCAVTVASTAVTAMGVDCKFDSRRCAVTTISWRRAAAPDSVGAGGYLVGGDGQVRLGAAC